MKEGRKKNRKEEKKERKRTRRGWIRRAIGWSRGVGPVSPTKTSNTNEADKDNVMCQPLPHRAGWQHGADWLAAGQTDQIRWSWTR